ncbi:Histidine kinase [Frankia sp. AiPs1]|uniref:histidine kinase n=1 Tax=Frankia sp. AiPa1 TaxID=573492 RepID=UPI00202B9957|nr:histidine kinase [Frankia sp. AiPa1]MCL9762033.1 histidine kinase [Frankia sp. AiPa1]
MSVRGDEGGPQSRELLRLLVALQERGQRALATHLHDGPMQEFTAILLELASVRRRLPDDLAERLVAIEERLRATTLALQLPPSAFRLGNDARHALISGLAQRVDGLLVDRLDTELHVEEDPPTYEEIAVALAAVQVLLLASNPINAGEQAWLSARSRPGGLDLCLRMHPSGHELPADEARAARLRPVADLIGADLRHDAESASWTATIHLGRLGRSTSSP